MCNKNYIRRESIFKMWVNFINIEQVNILREWKVQRKEIKVFKIKWN